MQKAYFMLRRSLSSRSHYQMRPQSYTLLYKKKNERRIFFVFLGILSKISAFFRNLGFAASFVEHPMLSHLPFYLFVELLSCCLAIFQEFVLQVGIGISMLVKSLLIEHLSFEQVAHL